MDFDVGIRHHAHVTSGERKGGRAWRGGRVSRDVARYELARFLDRTSTRSQRGRRAASSPSRKKIKKQQKAMEGSSNHYITASGIRVVIGETYDVVWRCGMTPAPELDLRNSTDHDGYRPRRTVPWRE
ncbi:hypothetical protein KC358_g72 [Hortaea werneckii]|nr:hypothetical protein KC358_g72 [Hortaea werneckii]